MVYLFVDTANPLLAAPQPMRGSPSQAPKAPDGLFGTFLGIFSEAGCDADPCLLSFRTEDAPAPMKRLRVIAIMEQAVS